MPVYYTQKFSNKENGGHTICCGAMPAHDHGQSNRFTTDIMEWLADNVAWQMDDILPGPFRSNQPHPGNCKEFQWNSRLRTWVKI